MQRESRQPNGVANVGIMVLRGRVVAAGADGYFVRDFRRSKTMNVIVCVGIVLLVCVALALWAMKGIGAAAANWIYGRVPGGRK